MSAVSKLEAQFGVFDSSEIQIVNNFLISFRDYLIYRPNKLPLPFPSHRSVGVQPAQ